LIRSIGLDVVEISRIRRDVSQFGDRFVRRILGEKERVIYDRRRDKETFLAGRFAAKEAVIKGLNPFLQKRPSLNVIQIVNDSTGAPKLALPPDIQQKLGGAKCLLSLTHEKNYAAAVAIFTEEK
jgi:holo-[acyl-carrier protein] synthase